MGYFRFTFKCTKCQHQWGSFFSSVDMSRGAHDCPKCDTKNEKDEYGLNPILKIADAWEYTDVKTGKKYWR